MSLKNNPNKLNINIKIQTKALNGVIFPLIKVIKNLFFCINLSYEEC